MSRKHVIGTSYCHHFSRICFKKLCEEYIAPERKISGSVSCARPFMLSRPRKFGNPLASVANLPQEVARSRRRIVTTRIYEGVLSSSDSNVRGKRCARVSGRGYNETREREGGRGGEAEASGGKYSRFQGNRVMTQFRKDR